MEPITIKLHQHRPYTYNNGDAYFEGQALVVYYNGMWNKTVGWADIHSAIISTKVWNPPYKQMTLDESIRILFELASKQWGFENQQQLDELLESFKLADKLEKE